MSALNPGFMPTPGSDLDMIERLEAVLDAFGATESDLQEVIDRRKGDDRRDLTLEDFYVQHEPESRLSPALRSTYRTGIRAFQDQCGGMDLRRITTAHVEAVVERLMHDGLDQGLSGTYQWEHGLRGIRFVLRLAKDFGIITRNPALDVSFKARPDGSRRALTSTELSAAFRIALTTGSDPELDVLILRFLRETACRRGALLKLTLGDIDEAICAVLLREKNRRRPRIPVSQVLIDDLRAHAAMRGSPLDDPHAAVFRYRDGTPLTARRFDSLFLRVQKRMPPVNHGGITAHWIRHTTLTDIRMLAGSDVSEAYAGHRPDNQRAIAEYTKVEFSELRAAHDRLFPVDCDLPHLPSRREAVAM